MRSILSLIVFLATLYCGQAAAEKIHVAVASNFTHTAKQLAALFEQETKHKISLAFGSSGKLTAQIRHGAPFQVFLSADNTKPQKLIDWGLADTESDFTYAIGTLTLWSTDPTLIDDTGKVLLDKNIQHVAIANPKLAPYGKAAEETLQHLGLSKELRPRLVEGENISQTFQFVASGTAKVGFIALSQILGDGQIKKGSSWTIPSDFHSPILQDAVLLKKGQQSTAAKEFLAFLKSPPAQELIIKAGYTIPSAQ